MENDLRLERSRGDLMTYTYKCGEYVDDHGVAPIDEVLRKLNAHDALTAIARRAIGTCVCHAPMRQPGQCLSCAARAALVGEHDSSLRAAFVAALNRAEVKP